ncbi:MAG: hypothetical protein GX111_04780 [Clostridiales bacterium]|jgi:CobQ-like glutamine amidotransferase family enzyme|nr:hypothetical protein [Clostridiales bacterium]
MKIEILYPELGNLFGDMANIRYLKLCLKDADFIETPLDGTPAFPDQDIDLIYMGPMTEHSQERAIRRLAPYREALETHIERGTHFLFTGNSMELLGKYIKTDEKELKGLQLFDMHAVRTMANRHNSLFLGETADAPHMTIVGFNSRFSHLYPSDSLPGFIKVIRGIGLNPQSAFEGIFINNFIGTYLLGPILVLNPPFAARFLRSLGIDTEPAFFTESLVAYQKRLAEFQDKKTRLD